MNDRSSTTIKFTKGLGKTIKDATNGFIEDNCPSMAAALAFYTLFSLPGLLIIIITLAGIVWNIQEVEQEILAQLRIFVGAESASQIEGVIEYVQTRMDNIQFATAMGIASLLFAASLAFVQIQKSLNNIWEVEPHPDRHDVLIFFLKRLLSFAMILLLATLLLVSLIISTLTGLIGRELDAFLPEGLTSTFIRMTNFLVSTGMITLLFTLMYKIFPDAKIQWKDVIIGAGATAILFIAGKELISFYLTSSDVGSAYGVASTIAILQIWVYLSAMIFYFGAEFTQHWALRFGKEIEPSKGAVRIIKKRRSRDQKD